MSRFERMVALPEEEYRQLRALRQTQNPLQNKFQTLSNEYVKQETIPDPYTRIQQQGETLNEMMDIKDQLRKRLVSMTPKPFQTRAQGLMRFVEDKVKVNEKGELLTDDNTVLHGSNITDLIQHAVRDRRRNMIPTGWDYFLNVLRGNNAPRMIMNYETLEDLNEPTITSPVKAVKSPFKATESPPKPFRSPALPTDSPRDVKLSKAKKGVKRMSASSLNRPMRNVTVRQRTRPKYLESYFVPPMKKGKYI